MRTTDVPKVSVCLVTYNQEAYLQQAIESVLAQETSFPVEIVIGEDCSTDGTRDIVARFASLFRGQVRPIYQTMNRGLVANFIETLYSCRGEYVALLDGDDYWTSPVKLERQVQFLDENPGCTICFHDVAVLLPGGAFCSDNYTSPAQERFSTVDDLFRTNFIATCAAMFRRNAVPSLPAWFSALQWEDWPLYVLLAERGLIGYLNEVWGVYRLHGHGLWSSMDHADRIEAEIRFLNMIDARLNYRHTASIKRSVQEHEDRLSAVRLAMQQR